MLSQPRLYFGAMPFRTVHVRLVRPKDAVPQRADVLDLLLNRELIESWRWDGEPLTHAPESIAASIVGTRAPCSLHVGLPDGRKQTVGSEDSRGRALGAHAISARSAAAKIPRMSMSKGGKS